MPKIQASDYGSVKPLDTIKPHGLLNPIDAQKVAHPGPHGALPNNKKGLIIQSLSLETVTPRPGFNDP